jgi:hypothetical protein
MKTSQCLSERSSELTKNNQFFKKKLKKTLNNVLKKLKNFKLDSPSTAKLGFRTRFKSLNIWSKNGVHSSNKRFTPNLTKIEIILHSFNSILDYNMFNYIYLTYLINQFDKRRVFSIDCIVFKLHIRL